jgi:hypothetical protein
MMMIYLAEPCAAHPAASGTGFWGTANKPRLLTDGIKFWHILSPADI